MTVMEAPRTVLPRCTDAPRTVLPRSTTLGETETEYVVMLDVTGYALDDLHVEIENHEVTVLGDSWDRRLDESVRLPRDADVEWVRAFYEPGQLELRVPRLGTCGDERRPVEIEVRRRVLQNPDATPC
jgi:HSP20 family molecular chaperone IbpA